MEHLYPNIYPGWRLETALYNLLHLMKDEGGMTKFKSIFRVPVNIQLEMRGWDRDGVTKQQQQPPVTLLTLGFSFSAEKQRHGDMVLRPGAGT